MSWRLISRAVVAVVALVACATESKVKKGEPQTAREKMRAEENANKNPSDGDSKPPGSKKWSGWRYQGDRKDCFFLVGRKCFKTENAACQAAKCKSPATCEPEGGGPATMRCVGGPSEKPSKDDDGDARDEKAATPRKG